jgi:hypothetical protein
MNAKFDELLRRGRERGFLTFDEANEVLPDNTTPEDVDRFLVLLEDNGIELINEAEAEERGAGAVDTGEGTARVDLIAPPVRKVPMFRRDSELERTLRRAGVELTDLACLMDSSGRVFDGRLIVPGTHALRAWRIIRDLNPQLGRWPFIGVKSRTARFEGTLDEDDPTPEWAEEVRREEHEQQARDLTAEAARLALDPRKFHRWHSSSLESVSAEAWEDLCRGPADDAPDAPANIAAGMTSLNVDELPFRAHRDTLTDEEYRHVVIVLAPTPVPWEVFAYYPYGGWNGAPDPAEQLAMLRHWYECYGAELVSCPGDWYELYVPRPPQSRADALRAIRELTGFGEETIFGYKPRHVEELIAMIRASHYWYFWWD